MLFATRPRPILWPGAEDSRPVVVLPSEVRRLRTVRPSEKDADSGEAGINLCETRVRVQRGGVRWQRLKAKAFRRSLGEYFVDRL